MSAQFQYPPSVEGKSFRVKRFSFRFLISDDVEQRSCIIHFIFVVGICLKDVFELWTNPKLSLPVITEAMLTLSSSTGKNSSDDTLG
ncbi:hypothetical protein TNCV_2912301 [Trichonephila clavipes]|nr:hypothetical protein TNCV_2912301 [Trichonephila clavipes]